MQKRRARVSAPFFTMSAAESNRLLYNQSLIELERDASAIRNAAVVLPSHAGDNCSRRCAGSCSDHSGLRVMPEDLPENRTDHCTGGDFLPVIARVTVANLVDLR